MSQQKPKRKPKPHRGEPPVVVPRSVPQPDQLPRRRAILAQLVARVTA